MASKRRDGEGGGRKINFLEFTRHLPFCLSEFIFFGGWGRGWVLVEVKEGEERNRKKKKKKCPLIFVAINYIFNNAVVNSTTIICVLIIWLYVTDFKFKINAKIIFFFFTCYKTEAEMIFRIEMQARKINDNKKK